MMSVPVRDTPTQAPSHLTPGRFYAGRMARSPDRREGCVVRVVMTGARGLIGSWAADELVRAGHEVVSVIREKSEVAEGLLLAQEEVIADAGDPRVLKRVCDGADGLVHLAAIPSPVGSTARELIEANTVTTVNVLEAAGEGGITAAVIASSASVLGMAWCKDLMAPCYLPVDEHHPLRPTEGYALSKEADEAAARMASRRWGMSIFALRFPFTHTRDVLLARATDPSAEQEFSLARELWGYLDVRDAAQAIRLCLDVASDESTRECTVLNIMADDVLINEELAVLMKQWHPSVGDIPGTIRGAYDVSRAAARIGFRAEHLLRGEPGRASRER
ncbi:MAG: hypothetical protein B5766_03225 [Candidatus Lumbricidophila eiseniae]|uniref:NAD-dependent epimerase/dehydratase domain-containing protein n=1 Tax=Candidatus Lumbricidiphila eiseniae TaxID=1969409 RepID=A0A2A6FU29_9MICO|nr:MAG: hypothetical protein B5766_03225 [Candidatus Lumbricidophila eiseniae]